MLGFFCVFTRLGESGQPRRHGMASTLGVNIMLNEVKPDPFVGLVTKHSFSSLIFPWARQIYSLGGSPLIASSAETADCLFASATSTRFLNGDSVIAMLSFNACLNISSGVLPAGASRL